MWTGTTRHGNTVRVMAQRPSLQLFVTAVRDHSMYVQRRRCMISKLIIQISGGTTTTFVRHLLTEHPHTDGTSLSLSEADYSRLSRNEAQSQDVAQQKSFFSSWQKKPQSLTHLEAVALSDSRLRLTLKGIPPCMFNYVTQYMLSQHCSQKNV